MTGLNDADNADAPGRGTLTHRTDTDSGDLEDRGRSWRCSGRSGVSDQDSGANADQPGFGRRGHAGVSDNDSGANSDSPGYGRRTRGDDDGDDGQGTPIEPAPSEPSPSESILRGDVGLPRFPWPPPRPTSQMVVPHDRLAAALGASPSFFTVGEQLRRALDRAGYVERTFYGVPGGFALVAGLERIRPDGSPMDEAHRWTPPGSEEFSIANYLANLFVAPTGYYRFIAFVATGAVIVPGSAPLSASRAGGLVTGGANNLPPIFRSAPFGAGDDVTALIYEFQKSGEAGRVNQLSRGGVDARVHLQKAGIYSALFRR